MRPGDVLANRFQLEAATGSGGMGEVYRAHDRFSGSRVAVKVLRQRRAGWDARFLREAEMLASLHHPAIVRHVAHGACPGGERYLVMEWLTGEDLASRLARGRLSVDDTLALARQVADALALAHESGVVHRDLKPQNLWLLDGDPAHVKVLDFGVARLESHSSLGHSAVIGTPGYMAPEQVRGVADVDARADVFALGCVLYECLTGQPLFQADHLIGMLAKILLDPAPSLRSVLPELPTFFHVLLGEMLAKERTERPANGAELRQRLDATGTREPARVDTLSMAERRSRTLLLVGSGIGTDGSPPDFSNHSTPGVGEQRVRGIVAAHGGTLEQLADGTAIVSFGDAVATDRAARAARCALALAPVCPQRALSLVTGRGDEDSRLGAAIDRGTAALASVSPEGRGGPIALDALTTDLLDTRFELQGSEHGVLLVREHELSHGARLLLGKATACVGRDYELAGLRGAFEACVQERAARAVLVTARPGIGKSRVAVELVEQLRRAQPELRVWIARGDPLRTGSAFGLLAQLLRARLAIREDDPLPQRQACIRERVAELVPDPERVASFLGELPNAPFDDHDNAPLRTARRDPHLMHSQLSRAFIDFVRAELAEGPLLWLLEDLHWADLPSMRFVDAALAQLGEQPWLVLALARPELLERAPHLWEERGLSVMHLKPLSARAGAQLVAQAVGLAPDDARVSKMVELAGGNAFFLEELARASDHGEFQLPETVLAMIEARLAGLDDQQRRVLRAASIFGEACWEGGLSRLMGGELDPVRLHHCLTQLIAEELLVVRTESRFAGERELAFRHALLREGAYAQLTSQDRSLGHRLAADWLEQHGEPSPAVLALHLERGGELARAGLQYASAARVANLGEDRDVLLSHARNGLRCGVPDRIASELHGLIIMVLGERSDYAAARPHIDALAALGAGDRALRLSYELVPMMVRALRSDRTPDLAALSLALEAAVAAPLDEASLDVFGGVLGWTQFELDSMGHYELSRRTSARYSARLRPFLEQEPTAAGWLALQASYEAMTFDDDPLTGLRQAERATRAFAQAEHARGHGVARTFIGLHAQALGDNERAAQELRAALAVDIGTFGSLRDLMHVMSLLDYGLLDEAEVTAVAMLERTRRRHAAERGRAHWARALVWLRRGERADSERELELAVTQLARWPSEHSAALLTVAAASMLNGEFERALSCCDRAQMIHERMCASGYRGVVGRYLPQRRAEVLLAMGRLEDARVETVRALQRVQAVIARIDDAAQREQFMRHQYFAKRTLALAAELLGDQVP